VYGFPILVRLNSNNFNFSSAQIDGGDIRFTKPDNTTLPYEIERWDPVAERAEVWVKVDTILGNDTDQAVMMFWGNPQAQTYSNGGMVFGSDNGFIGVWHLDSVCADATYNRYDGTNFGASDTDGIIGRAKKFNGQDSIRISGLMGEPASLTLSGWVKVDTTMASGQEIVTIGDAALIRADEKVGGYGTGGYAHRFTKNGDTSFTKVTSGQNIAKTGWRHVAFTFNNETHVHTLFIDGAAIRTDSSSYPIDYSGVGENTFIGAHGNNKVHYNSRGLIDEVRVGAVARSADWIKLCFMNQRIDGKLVYFK